MSKVFLLIILMAVICVSESLQAAENEENCKWYENYESQFDLQLESVEIHLAWRDVNEFKKTGNNTLRGPGDSTRTANYAMDAYTAPTWATSLPSVFSIEQYVFPGGKNALVAHRVVIRNNEGPWPTEIGLGYVWQDCWWANIFPPMPLSFFGTELDGNTLGLTLPYQGTWYISAEFLGFAPQEDPYDWAWMVDFAGTTPIPILPPPTTDMGGGSMVTFLMYDNPKDEVGDGVGSGRPWCFDVPFP